jgi:hypothetical protein
MAMMTMGCLDSHAAAYDPIMKPLELGGFLANTGLDCG